MHRDIKAENILTDSYGNVKLANFGMAKQKSANALVKSLKGTAFWIAPEVIKKKNEYNILVDIWSLGCTVIEMATGEAPWKSFEWMAAMNDIFFGKDIPDIPYHLSFTAMNFIMLCLQRDPSNRPTAAQLMDHPFVHD